MHENSRRWLHLFSGICEGILTSEEGAELDALIRGDSAVRRAYLNYLDQHANLRRLLAGEAPRLPDGCMTPPAPAPDSVRNAPRTDPTPSPWLPALARLNRATPFSLITAAVVVFAVSTLAFQFSSRSHKQPTPAAPTRSLSSSSEIVRLVWTDGTKWRTVGQLRQPGDALKIGERVEFVEGRCEIAFASGSRVRLQGPVAFQIESSSSGRLELGQLVAHVPAAARGFVINTPSIEIVDLGTEFGVSVGENAEAEVQVFKGAVELRPYQAAVAPHRLAAGQAVRVVPLQGETGFAIQSTAFLPDSFARLSTSSHDAARSAVELPVTQGLALWFSADHQVMLDRDERVFAWGDRLAGDNQTTQNAWQRDPAQRPRLVTSAALGGRPAIRFSLPRTSLVTPPLTLGNEQTVVAAFALDESTATGCGQVYNGNGPPHLVLQADRLQGVSAWAFLGEGIPTEPALLTAATKTSQLVVAAYVYSWPQNRTELYLAGDLKKEAAAVGAVAARTARWIGCHPIEGAAFEGDLGELLIYNAALSREQIQNLSHYLSVKYQVSH